MDIAVVVYEVSTLLPNDEKFNLIHRDQNALYLFLLTLLKDQGRNYDKEFVQNCKWVNF
jgi:hypothetical protein